MMTTKDELTAGRVLHALDLIRAEIGGLRVELAHQRELTERRIDALDQRVSDHETRLRDASAGVTQFRFWSTMTNGGSALMSLAALVRSFFA